MYDDFYHNPQDDLIDYSEIPDTDFVKEMLTKLVKSIYETGNISKMEESLEEILASYQMNMPKLLPKLQHIPKIRRNIKENTTLLKAQ